MEPHRRASVHPVSRLVVPAGHASIIRVAAHLDWPPPSEDNFGCVLDLSNLCFLLTAFKLGLSTDTEDPLTFLTIDPQLFWMEAWHGRVEKPSSG